MPSFAGKQARPFALHDDRAANDAGREIGEEGVWIKPLCERPASRLAPYSALRCVLDRAARVMLTVGQRGATIVGQESGPERRGAVIKIEARPQAVALDPARTAVIVVDMQNDFGSECGMFARAGIDVSAIRAVIGPLDRVLTAARSCGIRVVYLKMGFLDDLSDAGLPDAPNWLKHQPLKAGEPTTAPDGSPSRFLVRDTWNTEIVDELAPGPDDAVVYKHRFSGFYGTDLDAILQRLGIQSLIFTGCTTSVCVESTLRDAMFRDYRCVLLEDCAAEPIGDGLARSNHEASVLVIETLFGWVARSKDLLNAINQQPLTAAAN